ncbi:unnamed protein product [Cutaneotrichosporon oleaginosum]
MSPTVQAGQGGQAGRMRHASQLATVLEVEGRLSALDLEELNDTDRGWTEPTTPPASPASPLPSTPARTSASASAWRGSAIPPVLERDGEIQHAIAAAVQQQQVRETPAESGTGVGVGRAPVTLLPADERHVASAMAEHIREIHTAEIVPVHRATAVVLRAVGEDSAETKPQPVAQDSLPKMTTVSEPGWHVRVRDPPGTRRRSRMFGIGG